MSKYRRDDGTARSAPHMRSATENRRSQLGLGFEHSLTDQRARFLSYTPALDIAALLDRPIQAKIDGRLKKIHPHEAMLHGLFKRGMEGEFARFRC